LSVSRCVRQRGIVINAEQKVAVITGASQGISAELVRAFWERGYRVVANSTSIRPEDSGDVLAVVEKVGLFECVVG